MNAKWNAPQTFYVFICPISLLLTSSETLTVLPWDSPLLERSKQFSVRIKVNSTKKKRECFLSYFSLTFQMGIILSWFIIDLLSLGKLLPYCSNRAMISLEFLLSNFQIVSRGLTPLRTIKEGKYYVQHN